MDMKIEMDGKTHLVSISRGYVMVYVDARDCFGNRRSIDFPRIGKYRISREGKCHWTVSHLIRMAANVAATSIAEYEMLDICTSSKSIR